MHEREISPQITQTRDPSFRTDESVSEQDDKKGGLTRIARKGNFTTDYTDYTEKEFDNGENDTNCSKGNFTTDYTDKRSFRTDESVSEQDDKIGKCFSENVSV